MKNPRKTIIYLFLIFHLLHFIGALYIDARQDDLGFLLSIKGYLSWMKYFALTGVVLFLVAYIVVLRETRFLRKEIKLAKEEHTALKAKLFDYQEASKRPDQALADAETIEEEAVTQSGIDEEEEEKDNSEAENKP